MSGCRAGSAPVALHVLALSIALLLLRADKVGAEASPAGVCVAEITAALVDETMTVRPVPLHALAVISSTSDTIRLRTDLAGKAVITLALGRYKVISLAATRFGQVEYSWDISLDCATGGQFEVALTNDNASTRAVLHSSDTAPQERQDYELEGLFERLKPAVVRVEAGLAHGTGFLADSLGGVIVTNAHVVETADRAGLSVLFDGRLRVAARLLALDSDADIAILAIDPRHIADRPRLRLIAASAVPPVRPGERLVAFGYPLNQELTMTMGIASSIRAGAVISDVNINQGNSGGPLVNASGEVVAVNTFLDAPSKGPGISGSVLISRAAGAFGKASEAAAGVEWTDDAPLPVMPDIAISVSTLKAFAETTAADAYQEFAGIPIAGFEITVQTPAQKFVAIKAFENNIGRDRKKREARAGVPEDARYSEVREYRDWAEYVGVAGLPVIAISVVPTIGETGGSAFARIMISPYLQAQYRFRGDVRGVRLFRNDEFVEPIKGGHTPVKMYVENQWVSQKDVADEGYYVYEAEVFRPDSLGRSPSIVVVVDDLKSPGKPRCKELPATVVARAWNEFELFHQELGWGGDYRRADVKASRGRTAAHWRDGPLKRQCNWSR